jgi:hypothetical protein
MADLGAYEVDVVFDWAKATELAAELRTTATMLEFQVGERGRIKATPLEHWQGVYRGKFEGRVGICTSDASGFVTAMRDAATKLDELARLAREEQNRRVAAREWVANNDDGGVLDSIGDFFTGEDDLPPPPPPVRPPSIGIETPRTDQRALA